MKKTTSLLCVACALAEAVAFASPEDYRLHYDTPEQAQAHIARLWHPAEKDITRLWPEGKVQLRKADAPLNLLVRELYDSNVVATDVNDPFFVFYRAPDQRKAALCDLQRTIGILRARAADYNVDPGRIGVIGFSAGANLAVTAATNWRTRAYEKVDAADDVSCRPDFQMPIYPWDLLER